MKQIPFVVGQWVRGERFYGRRELIDEILGGPRDALWVLGTRRIGKTSLLKQLELLAWRERTRRYFPLFWDLQGAGDADELRESLTDALLDAEERLEEIDVDVRDLEAADPFATLTRLRRALRGPRLRLLLLCDEVEQLIELHEAMPSLLQKMRHAMMASGEVRSVLASTSRLCVLTRERGDTSPLLHGYSPPLYIGSLRPNAARDLVRQVQLPPEAQPSFEEDEIAALCRLCDHHPYLLQLVAKRLIEVGSLERAAEEVTNDPMVSYFFSVDFDLLAPIQRDILRIVSREESTDTSGLQATLALDERPLRAALATLDSLGLTRRDDAGRIRPSNEFFRHWLADLDRDEAPSPTVDPNGETPRWPHASSVLDDRYELRRKVGEGATGVVYEAHDRVLESQIAIKLLRREYAGNQLVLERFRQEILLSRNLGHPNILRLYHLGELPDRRAYLTMQWVDGHTLAEEIARDAPLAEARIAFLGARVASALAAAHDQNVLHRDVKPQNVLVGPGGEPLVTDFGLARWLDGPGVTTAGVFLGTPNYVSPEQSRIEPLDGRSDVYSLGVVLFEMATGQCPFVGDTAGEVLALHREQPAPDPRDLAPELSAELASLVHTCLEKDRDRRMNAGELCRALEALLPAEAPPPAPRTAAAAPAEPSTPPESSVRPSGPGSPVTAEELLPLVYDELRRLARGFLARERPDHTLQPTALVHEAYMKLAGQSRIAWAGRTHFFALGAKMMRRLLIDHARARARRKRGGDVQKITLVEGLSPGVEQHLDLDELLTLDAALDELAAESPRQAQIVEQRFFGGLTVEEVAAQLGLSKRTVESEWAAARDWLRRRLS